MKITIIPACMLVLLATLSAFGQAGVVYSRTNYSIILPTNITAVRIGGQFITNPVGLNLTNRGGSVGVVDTLPTNTMPGLLSGLSAGNGIGLSNVISDFAADAWIGTRRYGQIVVATNGITNAIAAVTGAINRRVLVYVTNGTYNEQITMKSWVDVVGQSRDGVIIQSSSTNADTILMGGLNSMLANLTVTHTTVPSDPQQYPIHCDLGTATSLPFSETIIYNVTAQSGGGYGKAGIGIGLNGSQTLYLVNSSFTSDVNAGIYIHNEASESTPTQAYFINCTGTSGSSSGLRVDSLGSLQADTLTIIDGAYTGGTFGLTTVGVGNDYTIIADTNRTSFSSINVTNGTLISGPLTVARGEPATQKTLRVLGNATIGTSFVGTNDLANTLDGYMIASGKIGVGGVATNFAADSRDLIRIHSIATGTNVGIFIGNKAASTLNNASEITFGNWANEIPSSPSARLQIKTVTAGTGATEATFSHKGTGASFAERWKVTEGGDFVISGNLVGGTSKGIVILGTNTIVAPSGLSVMGAHLWTDGTNLCVVMQNAAGTRTTNKVTVSAWP